MTTDAVAALAHRQDERLADDDRADEVVVDERLHVLDREYPAHCWAGLAAGRADVAAGAIDQDLHRPKLRFDIRPHLRDRIRSPILPVTAAVRTPYPSIAFATSPRSVGLAVFGRGRPVEVVDRNVGAVLREPLGHDASEAAARPGDECDLPAQFLGHQESPFT